MKTENTLLEITTKLNTKGLIIAGIIIIIGIVSLVLSWNITGMLLIIAGVIFFIVKPRQEIYIPTGSHVKRYSGYFDQENIPLLEKIVRNDITDETEIFNLSVSGNGKIDVITAKDKEFIAVQLFKFVPFTHVKVTDFICYSGLQAKQLSDYLDKCRKNI